MPLRVLALFAAATVALALPAQAQRFSAPANAGVYQIDENRFEVVVPSFKGIGVFWCGASDYARRVLGASWNTDISIARTLGGSVNTDHVSAVQFTLNPQALDIEPIRSTNPGVFPVGDTNSVQRANTGCDEYFFTLR